MKIGFSAIALFLLATVAQAADVAPVAPPRKVDFTQSLPGLDGRPMLDCVENDPQGKCVRTAPMTLGRLAAAALSVPERTLALPDQVFRGRLAARVLDSADVELTAAEAKTIVDQIAKMGASPYTVYKAVELIDPASVK